MGIGLGGHLLGLGVTQFGLGVYLFGLDIYPLDLNDLFGEVEVDGSCGLFVQFFSKMIPIEIVK
jgi:hypothetical protein